MRDGTAESTLRCHALSIFTSRCYIAPVSIAAHLPRHSLWQSLTEVSGATHRHCSVHVASCWSHWWANRKHSRCLCGHAVALNAVVNEDVGP